MRTFAKNQFVFDKKLLYLCQTHDNNYTVILKENTYSNINITFVEIK